MSQLSLFSSEQSETQSPYFAFLKKQQWGNPEVWKQLPLIHAKVKFLLFFRQTLYCEVLFNDRTRGITLTHHQSQPIASCSCHVHSVEGWCEHTLYVLWYLFRNHQVLPQDALWDRYQKSPWYAMLYDFYKQHPTLSLKVKLPDLLVLQNAEAKVLVRMKGKGLGTVIDEFFAGLLFFMTEKEKSWIKSTASPHEIHWDLLTRKSQEENGDFYNTVFPNDLSFDRSVLAIWGAHAYYFFNLCNQEFQPQQAGAFLHKNGIQIDFTQDEAQP
jgi:hypothetical protein